MQSKSVIKCIDNNRAGVQFTNSTNVILKSLIIANCGFKTFISDQGYVQRANVNLFFANVNNVKGKSPHHQHKKVLNNNI